MALLLKRLTDRTMEAATQTAAAAKNIKTITPIQCEVTIINCMGCPITNCMGCPITIQCRGEMQEHGKKVVGDGENYRVFVNHYKSDTYVWGDVWWKGWAHCRKDHPLRFDVFGRSTPQRARNRVYIKPEGIFHEKTLHKSW